MSPKFPCVTQGFGSFTRGLAVFSRAKQPNLVLEECLQSMIKPVVVGFSYTGG